MTTLEDRCHKTLERRARTLREDMQTTDPFFTMRNQNFHLEATGLYEKLPSDSLSSLSARVQLYFEKNRRDQAVRNLALPAILVGAIPFSPTDGDSLYQPRAITLQADSKPEPNETTVATVARTTGSSPIKIVQITEEPSGDDYVHAVENAQRNLLANDASPLLKVVLARSLKIEADQDIDPLQLLESLPRDLQATTFLTPIPLSSRKDSREKETLDESNALAWMAGASPELLISKRDMNVFSHPLAGSAPRSDDPVKDREAATKLMASEKDRYEHAFVVRAIEEGLRPYCTDLVVPKEPSLHSTATMWHLGTRISGVLRDSSVHVADLIAAIHPTPAVCGTPTQDAFQTIVELERFDRGFYGGAIGWMNEDGDGDWYIAIRCAQVHKGSLRLFAGAGIVPDSVPEVELNETTAKFKTWLSALGISQEVLPT